MDCLGLATYVIAGISLVRSDSPRSDLKKPWKAVSKRARA